MRTLLRDRDSGWRHQHSRQPQSRQLPSRPPARRSLLAAARDASSGTSYGLFVSSGSPAVAETLAHSGVDWLCLDTQHGAVGYAELAGLLQATASGRARTIVRVGGPSDRFGIQQALDQGAGGVMVPLVNSAAEAAQAVSYCRFPPLGVRSLVAPSRAMLTAEGFGGAALSRYLAAANQRAQVWLQVESVECLDALDDILASVPGIDCMFLGPADMAVSMGLVATGGHEQAQAQAQARARPAAGAGASAGAGAGAGAREEAAAPPPQRDLSAALSGPEMDAVHDRVLEACRRHGVAAGCFCLGPAAARQLAARGYSAVAFDVDLNMLIGGAAAAMAQLRRA